MLPASYLFSVVAARANGARTLVRRKVGWRRGLEVTQRESAVPAFLRDKSRAPGPFLVGALNTYPASCRQNETMRDRTICRRDAGSTLEPAEFPAECRKKAPLALQLHRLSIEMQDLFRVDTHKRRFLELNGRGTMTAGIRSQLRSK